MSVESPLTRLRRELSHRESLANGIPMPPPMEEVARPSERDGEGIRRKICPFRRSLQMYNKARRIVMTRRAIVIA